MSLPLVDLRDVTVIAGGHTLLHNVTLSIQPGDAVRLYGPNGGGKTTLLRLLSGEVAPVRGERVYGLRGGMQTSAVQARRALNIVGPDAEAFYLTRDWQQTVQDVLLAALAGETLNLWEADAASLKRLKEVVALTHLEPLLERDFRTLSHGQRRRAILARALMPQPELVLLDEFTDGLSSRARAELGGILRDIHAAGVAIVLATHRPDEAPELNWRTVRVQEGKVSFQSSAISHQSSALVIPHTAHRVPRTLVRLTDATVYRNGHRALGPISWIWQTGQHWLVTGENGSGKSTLARLVAGELHASLGGRVERPYLRRDLLSQRRRTIGLVAAEVGIRQRRDWTGRDVIGSALHGTEGFAPELTETELQQVEEIAARLRLTELLDRNAETLSQGQLRRLLLARAVLHHPTLLILDEGLDFVDADSRALFHSLLPELIHGGTHLLVIAHRDADAPAGLTHHLQLEAGLVASQTVMATDQPSG